VAFHDGLPAAAKWVREGILAKFEKTGSQKLAAGSKAKKTIAKAKAAPAKKAAVKKSATKKPAKSKSAVKTKRK